MFLFFGKNRGVGKLSVLLLLLSVFFGVQNISTTWSVSKKIVSFASFPVKSKILTNETKNFDLAFKTSGILVVTLKSQISSGRSLRFVLNSGGETFKELFSSYSPINSRVGWEIKDVSNYSTLSVIGEGFVVPLDIEINYEPYFVQFFMLRAKVWVNGYPEDLDVAPYFVDKNEMLPLRYVTQSLGARVDWKDKTNSATVYFYNKTMKFEIGSRIININGVNKIIPVAPEIKDSRTYLPMYVLINILNLDCDYKKDIGIIFLGGKL
jgi:hypothetical protein